MSDHFLKHYPIKCPGNIPSGLVAAYCMGCSKGWWIDPPPADVGHCMCCKAKLRFVVAEVKHP